MSKETIESLVEGGKASPGPPLGPALGPLGVNIGKVVNAVNEKTEAYEGMQVPVKIIVDTETNEFEIEVGTPPTSQLIKNELGIESGASDVADEVAGDLTIEEAKSVAKKKEPDLLAADTKAGVKEVLGACVSMGINCEGKDPRIIQKEIDDGKWNDELGGE